MDLIFADNVESPRSVEKMIGLCEQYPGRAKALLCSGEITDWLTSIHEADLAESTKHLTRSYAEHNLNEFISICKSSLSPQSPRLDIRQIFEKLAKQSTLTFLLLGRTGVGKSSTVNSFLGKDVCPVGDFEVTTQTFQIFETKINGVDCRICDTPGFADGTNKESQYLEIIRREVGRVDCVWFVTNLAESRIRSDEIETIRLITSFFGKNIWEKSLIVLTHADWVNSQNYQHTLQERSRLLRERIYKETSTESALSIPTIAISNKKETTPDGDLWLGELFTHTLTRISNSGTFPLLAVTSDRLKIQNSPLPLNRQHNIPINQGQKRQIKQTLENKSDFADSIKPILKTVDGALDTIEPMVSFFTPPQLKPLIPMIKSGIKAIISLFN